MNHAAGLGGQFAHRHAELLGAGLQQHGAGQGAEAAHDRIAHAHRHAAAGDAHAVVHHHIGFAGRRGFDEEGRRVGVQFFADNLRHGGVGALPAFHERAEQAYGAVRANLQKRRHLGAAFSVRRWQPAPGPSRAAGRNRCTSAPTAVLARKRRRDRLTGSSRQAQRPGMIDSHVHQAVSFPRGQLMHGGMDGVVGAAAAQIDHRRVDLRIGGRGGVLEQRGGGHHLPGLAVTALGDLVLDPGGDHALAHVIGSRWPRWW